MKRSKLPQARKDQLIVKELADETLVYDLADDKAHCLNQTAALVWKNCDGEKSISEINASLVKEVGAPVDEQVVWLALDQLEKFKLLADAPVPPAVFQGLSRRQLMRNLGVAAITLPVIMSIAAPVQAQVASCQPTGFGPCVPGTNCCSGTGNCTTGAGPKTCV